MSNHRLRQGFALVAALLAAALAGCASDTTSGITATDRGVFIPSGRAAVDITPKGETPSHPHSGHGIELGISAGSGDDTQALAAGALPVVFGGQTFSTSVPVTLAHDFDFRFYELAYRYRKFFGASQEFGIEALGGLAYADLDLTVSAPGQRASESLQSGGIVGGFGIVWKFRPSTSLQSRVTFFGSGDEEGVSYASRLDVYVAQAIGRHAALRAGFAGWNVRSERDYYDISTSNQSTIRVRFSGPAIGLDLMF